jgi:hypothetical protein
MFIFQIAKCRKMAGINLETLGQTILYSLLVGHYFDLTFLYVCVMFHIYSAYAWLTNEKQVLSLCKLR